MTYRIKNWKKFQHFKDRKPPWIKLYRDILDDVEWHHLPAESAKLLVMLWLIASEREGTLPATKQLAFRLRVTEKNLNLTLSTLVHWLEGDDINMISNGYQHDAPETETETETETEDVMFQTFWKAYPKKIGKGSAEKAFKKISPVKAVFETMLRSVAVQSKSDQWLKEGGQFIPHPATWLNQKRWEDEVEVREKVVG